jgi:uncharacterized membrane protein
VLPSVAAGASEEIAVAVTVPADAAPGRYLGVVRATTDPVTEVALSLTVTPPGS